MSAEFIENAGAEAADQGHDGRIGRILLSSVVFQSAVGDAKICGVFSPVLAEAVSKIELVA